MHWTLNMNSTIAAGGSTAAHSKAISYGIGSTASAPCGENKR